MIPPKGRYDTDYYKLTMGNYFWRLNMLQNRQVDGLYEFVDREEREYTPRFADELKDLAIERSEYSPNPYIANDILKRAPYMPADFIQWYDQVFFHDPSQLDISVKDKKLRIFAQGPIHTATHHEIPILTDVSTLITKNENRTPKYGWQATAEENAKIFYNRGVMYSEGGGRRALNRDHHYESLGIYGKYRKGPNSSGGLAGSSWVSYAADLNFAYMGTMAHEFVELQAGLHGYKLANKMAMQAWVETYGKRLGYFLPDTITTRYALRDFDRYYASIFEGTRQDSMDPIEYVNLMLDHYEGLKIKEPRKYVNKSIIFSNSLRSVSEIIKINEYRKEEYNRRFLLGGFITNNAGYKPYNIVMKLVAIRIAGGPWIDLVKFPDDPRKAVGKPEAFARLYEETGLKL